MTVEAGHGKARRPLGPFRALSLRWESRFGRKHRQMRSTEHVSAGDLSVRGSKQDPEPDDEELFFVDTGIQQ